MRNLTLEQTDILSTPIWTADLKIPMDEMYSLYRLSIEMSRRSAGVRRSNRGNAWQSDSLIAGDIYLFDNVFSRYIMPYIEGFTNILNSPLFISNYWININYNEDFNAIHTHPNSILSGVFYIKASDQSGDLVFEDPNKLNSYILGDQTKWLSQFPISHLETPFTNKLVLFPSWIPHHVQSNKSTEERIAVAFNCREIVDKV